MITIYIQGTIIGPCRLFAFNNGNARVRDVHSDGSGNSYGNVDRLDGVRPTLNLIPDSLKVGSGTAADPYMVG